MKLYLIFEIGPNPGLMHRSNETKHIMNEIDIIKACVSSCLFCVIICSVVSQSMIKNNNSNVFYFNRSLIRDNNKKIWIILNILLSRSKVPSILFHTFYSSCTPFTPNCKRIWSIIFMLIIVSLAVYWGHSVLLSAMHRATAAAS